MKTILRTDFLDYYDHWFDRCHSLNETDYCFRRYQDGNHPDSFLALKRSTMFALFVEHGLRTPRHGKVEELVQELTDCTHGPDSTILLVVYLDELSHRGDDKVLSSIEDALKKFPGQLASVYLGGQDQKGVSYRYLRAGFKEFWLRYQSCDDWRSNCGDVQVDLLSAGGQGLPSEVKAVRGVLSYAPLVAVDFVRFRGSYHGIDINLAPGMRRTGIGRRLSAKKMADNIKDFIKSSQDQSLFRDISPSNLSELKRANRFLQRGFAEHRIDWTMQGRDRLDRVIERMEDEQFVIQKGGSDV